MDDVVVLGISSARHSCKVCGKGFPCGRSLGGHMRSHSLAEVAMADDAADSEDDDKEEESGARGANGAVAESGYGLRENPKKTRRLSGLDDDDDGEDDRGETEMFSSPEPALDDYADAVGEHDEVARDDDDEEHVRLIPAEAAAVLMPAPRRRRRSMRVPAPAPAPPPPLDAFDREPEDVALCLIMLSRDTPAGNNSRWAAAAAPAATADRRKRNGGYYHYHHDAGDSDDASAFFEIARTKQKRKAAPCGGEENKRSGRYECPGCGRAFQSYQALGGHRASHKRINSSCCITKVALDQQPEPSTETNTSFSTASAPASPEVDRAAAAAKAKRMVSSKFECPICFKVFGSGQALGGHKRSHSIAGELYYDRADVVEPEQQLLVAARFLDLNLPAPGAED